MNLRNYFKNLSLLYIFNFSIKPLWVFGLERKFQLILGQEDYGKYFYFLSEIYILSIFLDLGLHQFSTKIIAENVTNGEFSIFGLLKSKLTLILLYIIFVFIAINLQNIHGNDYFLFWSMALMQLLFSIYQFERTIIQGLQKHRWDSFLSSLDRLFLIIGGSILLLSFTDQINLTTYIYLYIVSYIASIVLISWLISTQSIKLQDSSANESNMSKIFKQAYPLILIQLMMTIYTRIDTVMLKYLYPNGYIECGNLAFAFRFVDSAYNALYLITIFLLPTVAHLYTENKVGDIRKLVLSSWLIATGMSFLFFVLAFVFSDKIYNQFYHTDNHRLIEIFKYQLGSVLGVGWMYVFGSYMTAIGKFWQILFIVTLGMILSLGLNYLWIPSQGALGAALSANIVQNAIGVLHIAFGIYFLYQSKKTV